MNTSGVKERLLEELNTYFINFLYILAFFSVFTLYHQLVVAEMGMSYGNLGTIVIKALILAKVIMLGDMLRIGRRMEHTSLIVQVFYKTVTFSLWVIVFRLLEITLVSLFHGQGLAGIQHELLEKSPYEMLAHALIVIVVFFPFFSLKGMADKLGREKVKELFLARPS